MPPFLTRTIERARTTLTKISLGQRIVIGLLLVGLILGGVFFTKWVTTPTYAPLFSNLGSSDASAIVAQLNTDGVPYQLADGGATIMVPQDKVASERLAVSAKNLPAGSDSGYTLLDQQGITTSEFQQQVTYQRAIEGELSKTLTAINGVQDAVVHVAIPKQDVFATDQGKPTASVLLNLTAGTNLSGEQVQAITHLVASSIQGMNPADVTVADQKGRVLSAAGDGLASGLSDTQLQAEQDAEARLAANAQQILDRIAGPGNAVVSVKADLNFDNRNTTSKTYTYTPGTPPLSQTNSSEKYSGSGAVVGGVLGPDNSTTTTTGGAPSTYTQDSATADNAVGETTQQTTSAPGQIQRLTVSVAIDSAVAKKAGINQAQLQALVGNAVGLNTARGDAITVASMPFDQSASKQAAADLAAARQAATSAQMWQYIRLGGVAALVALIALIAWLRTRRRGAIEADEAPSEAVLRAQAEMEKLHTELARLRAGETAAEPEISDEEVARRKAVRTDIETMINDNPDDVTAMLRGWLAEDHAR